MGSRREKRRSKKRALKLRDEAWEAARAGNLPLAGRLIHHALEEGPGNARSWLVLGRIQGLGGAEAEAEASLRHAVELSPDYADALAELAGALARSGRLGEAIALEERVLALEPGRQGARERLRAWRERLPAPAAPEPDDSPPPTPPSGERTARYDWEAVEAELLARGCALLPALLDAEEQRAIDARALGAQASELVAELRRELYWRLAPLAERRAARLGDEPGLPALYEELAARRRRAGRGAPAASLRAVVPGEPPAARHPTPEADAFPYRVDVVLGAPGPGPVFQLVDARHGRRRRGTELDAASGDGVVSCARERLVLVGGVYGLQPVLAGFAAPPETRWRVLALPL